MIRIRDLIVDPPTFLSPMAGLTDSVFRRLIKRLGGCGLVMTEFTSAEGLTRNSSEKQADVVLPRRGEARNCTTVWC